jgi:putative NIF3 family GTP cyclohydrolase 1 type 2
LETKLIQAFTALLFAHFAFAAEPPTAAQIIERIQKNVGVSWHSETVDTIKAGDPNMRVTGIVTTFAATLDVLERAVASGKNLIVTHEPTFYNHLDQTAEFENDPVYKAKRQYIDQHKLVVFRFHDHWHARKPDGILEGMTSALGWQKFRNPANPHLFVIPEQSLDRVASDAAMRLQIKTLRVVGDPKLKVTKIGLLPGAAGETAQVKLLEMDDVEVLVVGEAREWETAEYTRDAVAEGRHKALLILGHVVSEEAGMDECARWLKTFVTDVPVEFMPAKEPFWRPN